VVAGLLVTGTALGGPAAAQGLGALPAPVTALAASPDDATIWIGTSRGLWRTEEAGHAATAVALPVPVAPEITAVASASASPREVYVATAGQGVFRTENRGQTWADANNGLGGLDVRALAVSPTDGRLHVAVRGKGLFWSRTQARFWHFAEAGPVGTLYGFVSVNLPTGMGGIFLYASTDQGLLRSADCF
jgi:ligand-binding sensor domain-containing protein